MNSVTFLFHFSIPAFHINYIVVLLQHPSDLGPYYLHLLHAKEPIQSGRIIGVIIITDDYLCYKKPKSPYNFFLILIFNELFKYKTSDESNIDRREAYAVIENHFLSLQLCRDFQTRKLA